MDRRQFLLLLDLGRDVAHGHDQVSAVGVGEHRGIDGVEIVAGVRDDDGAGVLPTIIGRGGIERAVGGRKGSRIHPATRSFQALRIAVNQELEQLEHVLPQCLQVLAPRGRLAVISFHSLEDRIVKHWMQQEARSFVPDRTHPQGGYEQKPALTIVTRKPNEAGAAESAQNPRSRSAKLRIAEKLP